jgi:hypothetical protein
MFMAEAALRCAATVTERAIDNDRARRWPFSQLDNSAFYFCRPPFVRQLCANAAPA